MRIAFIGLGAMGNPMSLRLADVEGIDLTFFDLQADKLQAMEGRGRLAESVADAIGDADAIFTVLPADRHVKQVVEEIAAASHPGQIYMDFSTIAPETIDNVAEKFRPLGVEVYGAGMTKSITGAETGTLVLFVGGPPKFAPILEVAFDALTSEVRFVGEPGVAKALKLVNNMVVSCLDVAICEGLALGTQLDVKYEELTDSMERDGANNWPLHNHIIKHVLPNDLGPGFFSTRFLMKDLTLGMSLATQLRSPMVFTGVALASYRGTVAWGWGDDYHMIVIRWLERCANLGKDHQSGGLIQNAIAEKSDVIRDITGGVAAVQALVSLDALGLLARMGVDPGDAAAHLEAGSAGNDALRSSVRFIEGKNDIITPSRLLGDLESALSHASSASVPATMLEVARSYCLQLAHSIGDDAEIWDYLRVTA